MDHQEIFERLWVDYIRDNNQVGPIYELFTSMGETVINDHVAFRTFDDPRVNIDQLAKPFLESGYQFGGDYEFTQKKLLAKHYEHPNDPTAPKVFISELKTSEFSDQLQAVVKRILDQGLEGSNKPLIFSGRPWQPIYHEEYQSLLLESEYAAWLYAFGYRANHFTVLINALDHFHEVQEVNELLLSHQFNLNTSGGLIKGTPADFLEQSSTLASKVAVDFVEGTFEIPCCYYEFAKRYLDSKGQLYSGFVVGSADKIFESTDVK